MGEGTTHVTHEEESPARLEREVDELRDRMTGLVGELDRRRHELFDWRLQLRRHGRTLGLVGAGLAAVFWGARALARRRNRRHDRSE
jgi:hypothetical protein